MISIFEMRTILPQAKVKEPEAMKRHRDEEKPRSTLYGLMAEFDDPTAVVAAARRAYEEGYRKMDAFTPLPDRGADGGHRLPPHEAPAARADRRHTRMRSRVTGMQYWASAIYYPLNVGGRPLHSWPSFIPVTFEMTILVAALAAVFGMLALNGLPQPYHPVFNAPKFRPCEPQPLLSLHRGAGPEV